MNPDEKLILTLHLCNSCRGCYTREFSSRPVYPLLRQRYLVCKVIVTSVEPDAFYSCVERSHREPNGESLSYKMGCSKGCSSPSRVFLLARRRASFGHSSSCKCSLTNLLFPTGSHSFKACEPQATRLAVSTFISTSSIFWGGRQENGSGAALGGGRRNVRCLSFQSPDNSSSL